MKYTTLLFALFIGFLACSSPQNHVTLDTDRLIADIEYLASDELEGRYVDHREAKKHVLF